MNINAIRLNALRREISHFPTLAAFARHYSLDSTYISQLLNGHRNLGEKAARNLEVKLGRPTGSMDRPENDMGGDEAVYEKPAAGLQRVPRISFVQAGLWAEASDPYAPGAGDDYLLTQLGLGPHAFALAVRGESMEPEFKEGDTIIIDPDVKPMPGDFVVAKNSREEATFKKYRPRGINEHGELVIELVPLNPDFPSLRSDHTPIQIIGTMMEHRRYRKPRRT
ncbi:MAG: LexA family protein [Methylococcaceae bacterium]|jgi:SOS-response transcriptional repressor LexA